MSGKIVLKRKIYDKMLVWKNEHAPDYALFIKGARRTGKTTIAEEFGKKEYKSFITINFQKASDEVKNLFVNGLMDLDLFFITIEKVYMKKLYPHESLIILDEIQLFPKARQALKTLLEDKRFDYIETGSLAGIRQKSKKEKILIPSEEEHIEMYPLDFEEYLWATENDFDTFPLIRKHLEEKKPFGQTLCRELLKKFRTYMCIGGMPQSIIKYMETKDFAKVDFTKKTIINLYHEDIKDQDDVNNNNLFNLFDNIPSELSKHDKQYVISHAAKSARLAFYKESIGWLEDAMIVNVARNVSEPSPALSLSLDDIRFKMYLADTGLLIDLAFADGSYFDNEYYNAILFDKLHVNEGMFIENLVAQCLVSNGHKLRYHTKVDKKLKKTVREVDFIIRKKNKIVPIEVKSSDNFTIKSILDFKNVYSNKVGECIVLSNSDIKTEDSILYLPYFMAAVL
ncbi:MAG: AAA family ATPase [Erysipelotrichaceae bacterium]|nr:AAA family ATPase [Erysipelotrichaceae bacterium]